MLQLQCALPLSTSGRVLEDPFFLQKATRNQACSGQLLTTLVSYMRADAQHPRLNHLAKANSQVLMVIQVMGEEVMAVPRKASAPGLGCP